MENDLNFGIKKDIWNCGLLIDYSTISVRMLAGVTERVASD